ncbi:MAG: ribosomal protein S18-alanine N-acetyltransferase [Acidimicrobiales bacterium]|nr:ribosomal protein S18-alanine N-acetyltransferase [Acidimicrobiales bacterium]
MTNKTEIQSLAFRELTFDDLDAVAAIEASVAPSPWSRTLFEGELSLPAGQRLWLVAQQADQVVGFAGVMFVGDDVHVMNIAVAPNFQRQGIARRLLATVLRRSVVSGARHATLEVRDGNDAAIELYRRFRLGPVGIRNSYYEDGEDALILWAHDIHLPSYIKLLDRLALPREAIQ